MAFSLNIL
jgi:RES domain-containing protein